MSRALRCPVCSAPMRGEAECTRCGADLAPCLRLVVRAWDARRRGREALLEGRFQRALAMASRAQQLHATRAGRRLELLAGWLVGRSHGQAGTDRDHGP